MNMKIRANHLEPMGFDEFSRLIDMMPATRSPIKVEPLAGHLNTQHKAGRSGKIFDLSQSVSPEIRQGLRLVNGY
ncbi:MULTISPECIES: hypothetical protein [unclassified Photobacterium]|uniref:hypothetical protein n=1 Tax=unclassified Photobacterium TaxID=2628852 RepID=UPI001B8D91BD|nr:MULTISPECIES: hypothetical protein [unclassified Photobacterium]MDO6705063.1 hypothetical protein [Photobacterium sp. 1_MG-2023]QUJ66575.1 hypothetical protein KDD30_10410 [Photobacterium sp. GJ3]